MNIMTPVVRDPKQQKFDTRDLLANARQQGIDRRYEDFMIIDVDAHHYETSSYKEIFNYIEDPVMRDQFIYTKGATQLPRSTGGFQEMAGRITRYQHRASEQAPTDAPHRDIGLTRKWMDALGVDVCCIFPTPMLGLGLNPIVEVEVQFARAYNRWLTEHILAEEPRMVSMLYLPMNDPVAALKMVEEFAGRKGVIGFLVTTVRYKPLYDNAYMKLYRALEERGLPLGFHAATNWGDQSMHISNKFIAIHALGFSWFNILHMTNWVVNGIPERFPGLKSIWIEFGSRLGAFRNAAPRQRIHDAKLGSADAQTHAERLHARDVLHLAADGGGRQSLDAARDVQDDQCREPTPLRLRLSALGHGPAERDPRPAVPQPAGQAQHPGRKRAQAVQARPVRVGGEAGAAEGPRRGGVRHGVHAVAS